MKRLLLSALAMVGSHAMALNMVSGELVPADAKVFDIPANLAFGPSRTTVLNSNWYLSLFGGECGGLLSEGVSAGSLTVKSEGPHQIYFKMDGRPVKILNQADADYVPVHYRNSEPVHPSFQLRMPDWVSLHLEIHKLGNGKKILSLYVIQGRPGMQKLTPVLEAIEN